jgi:hypothetical protein
MIERREILPQLALRDEVQIGDYVTRSTRKTVEDSPPWGHNHGIAISLAAIFVDA